jgi:uncharacterized membrane protein YsdA (DUF1294 family)
VVALALWLCLAPPVGLWKLWEDRTFSRTAKWRIVIYLFLIPSLAYVAVSLWVASHTLQRLMP